MQAFEIDIEPPSSASRNIHPVPEELGKWILSPHARERFLATRQIPSRLRKRLERASSITLSDDAWADARERLIMGAASRLTDALPADVHHEVLMMLYARPGLRLEYAGRGTVMRVLEPGEESRLVAMDIAGGKRRYYFRSVGAHEQNPAISDRFRRSLAEVKQWLDDPDAKLVMSIGSGGYRMFAITSLVKILDQLMGDRTCFSEVWGCSGGSVAAHIFSEGFDPWVIDEFGYQIYHRRNSSLPDFSVASVSRLWMSKVTGQMDKTDKTIQHEWIRALDDLQPKNKRRFAQIPFYAVSSNRNSGRLFALTDPENVSPQCEDFVVSADRGRALAASCAVPLIFPTQRGVQGADEGGWMDGGLIDENPLALPFVKWCRERKHDPEGTPKKLKIFMLDLNARAAESSLVTALSKIPLLGRYGVDRVVRILDILLDSRSNLTLEIFAELPNVEVYRAKLSLGAFAVRDRQSILHAIQGGRKIDSWEMSTIGKNRR